MSSDLPRRPPRPSFDEPPPRRSPWFGIVFALSLGIAVLGGIVFLAFVWLPAVIVIALGSALALFHYVVWGWWLGRILQNEADEEREGETRRHGDKEMR